MCSKTTLTSINPHGRLDNEFNQSRWTVKKKTSNGERKLFLRGELKFLGRRSELMAVEPLWHLWSMGHTL